MAPPGGEDDSANASSSSVPSAAPLDDESSAGGSTIATDDGTTPMKNDDSAVAPPPHPIAAAAAAAASEKKPPVDPDDESLRLKTLGNADLTSGRYLSAIRYYSEALEHTPTNAIILSNRALAYIKVENYGLAILDSTKAIESDPEYAKGYYRRGTANFALNKPKSARKDFKFVCKLKPKDRDARMRLQACEKAVREAAFAAAIVSEETEPLSATYDPNLISVDAGYDGPHPAGGDGGALEDGEEEAKLFEMGKLPREFVMASVQRFKEQKLIHKRYVARLLLTCRHYFDSIPSLVEIPIPDESPDDPGNDDTNDDKTVPRVTVCGDTHGQFYDVLHIFEMNGFPSKTNPYLFNGDFVDRGSFSVEVILTYLLFKVSDPSCIYLSRGNHETKNMNKIYGFEGEVKAKYDDKIFELFLEVFCHLPLAATVGEKVFVTHGGLPTDPNVTLDDVRSIKRGCEPPDSGLMSDLLWSDPQPFPGKSPSKRGVGYSFGPDVTENFLTKNGLSLLVRSHEVKDEGYLVEHGGKTITVFSAPNYCDSMGNKGAFVHFGKDLTPKFTQYEAAPHPDVKPMAYAAGMGGLFM